MKQYFFIAACISMLIQTTSAQTIKIWSDVDKLKHKKSALYAYLPEKAKSNRAAVIICPGGSYCHLGMKQEGHKVAKRLTEQGFTAFVLRYRVGVSAKHPDMMQDIQRSIQLIHESVQKFNIDSSKVGLMGFSAGGHLVGCAATHFNQNFMSELKITPQLSLRPAFAVMVYPVVTMRAPYAHKKSRKSLLGVHPSENMLRLMSLEENTHTDMPPILVFHAKDDKTVDYHNSVLFGKALDENNVKYKFILYNTGGHGFGASPNVKTETAAWVDDFIKWYKETIN